MSLSALLPLITTTGMALKLGTALITARTSWPFIMGRFRSRNMMSGRTASAYFPSHLRYATASSPFVTTLIVFVILASRRAVYVRKTSASLSSTIKISTDLWPIATASVNQMDSRAICYPPRSAVQQVGWKVLDIATARKPGRGKTEGEEPRAEQVLPSGLKKGDPQEVVDVEAIRRKTRPPKRLTEGTLLTAMET